MYVQVTMSGACSPRYRLEKKNCRWFMTLQHLSIHFHFKGSCCENILPRIILQIYSAFMKSGISQLFSGVVIFIYLSSVKELCWGAALIPFMRICFTCFVCHTFLSVCTITYNSNVSVTEVQIIQKNIMCFSVKRLMYRKIHTKSK